MVKFAHLADVHLGGWKHKPLRDLNFQSFQKALEILINEKVEFLLIAGDLFDTAYPPIEILKETFAEFKKLKEAGIPCFIISGSHDYSVSGRTFIDVLEKGGFCKNVTNFDKDEKNNLLTLNPTIHNRIAFYGYPGKKSGLEVYDLKNLKLKEPTEPVSYKILMLHTTIDKAVGDLPIDYLDSETIPKTDYCALGHIHILLNHNQFVYPGPVFPNNFTELEDLNYGHFCIVDTENSDYLKRIELKIKDVERVNITIDDNDDSVEKIISELNNRDLTNKIILLRLKGELENSKISDIKFSKIEEFLKQKNAYFLLKNTHELKTKEIEIEAEIEQSENIEEETIKIYSEQNPSQFDDKIFQLINSLSIEKQEGETSETFLSRIMDESKKILKF